MRHRAAVLIAGTSCLVVSCATSAREDVDEVQNVVFAIDEGHHNVHRLGGSYAPLGKLANQYGLEVITHTGRFTTESLATLDVLAIGNARAAGPESPLAERGRPAFDPEELKVLLQWVRAGGSLLLVIDHSPIGGANAQLAELLGVDMLDGSTEDPAQFEEEVGAIVFKRSAGRIADHPITCGRTPGERVDRVATFFGASLDGSETSTPLLLFTDEAVDRVGFEKVERSARGRNQGLVLEYGRGKVVVLGEAAMLRVFAEGTHNDRFAANLVQWLAGLLPLDQAAGCEDRN